MSDIFKQLIGMFVWSNFPFEINNNDDGWYVDLIINNSKARSIIILDDLSNQEIAILCPALDIDMVCYNTGSLIDIYRYIEHLLIIYANW